MRLNGWVFLTTLHYIVDGGICNTDMSNKQLLLACGSARQKHDVYLEKQKAVLDEGEQLNNRKRSLMLTRSHSWLLQIMMVKWPERGNPIYEILYKNIRLQQ